MKLGSACHAKVIPVVAFRALDKCQRTRQTQRIINKNIQLMGGLLIKNDVAHSNDYSPSAFRLLLQTIDQRFVSRFCEAGFVADSAHPL
jgi:hypothetical protein